MATALLIGESVATAIGKQYVVTMNSDIFKRLPLPEGFDSARNVLSTRLSDKTETGGLFGLRF